MELDIGNPAHFQNEPVPEGARLAGWAALVHALDVKAPVRNPACISERHVRGNRRGEGIWEVYDKRYQPEDTLDGHLGFALRHEPIDLLVLKRILDALPEQDS